MVKKRRLYLASNNRHKQAELAALIGDAWELGLAHDLQPDISWEETGTTFLANATIKAEVVKQHTDACVLADDSGLVVEALGGAPGVFSSRYAGREGDDAANNLKLLKELKGVAEGKRQAKFVCTLVFIDERGQRSHFTGECLGEIALAPRGEHGFGYDPLFLIRGTDRTLAELSDNEKNKISHRQQAVSAWLSALRADPTSSC